ncbi:alpha/beta hydrolase family protein [Lactococcus lactis]|uniref:alpha/beta hydrolase family protein n=1 Tax=Lactococcus lactis TaxID=1358 RepID=UPI00204ECA0E|nr:alpha/beta fold hydrolase [Lactococcus lactis]BDH85018.1 hypothetical protein LLID5_23030 [Lactococcus lactis]
MSKQQNIIFDHAAIGSASRLKVNQATPIFSISPITLTVPNRVVDLQIRVSGPTTGNNFPVILLSHGLGHSNYLSSLHGYAPLVDFLASQGFVVIQPTHLDSNTLAIDPKTTEVPFWKSRVDDMSTILDNLEVIEELVPQISNKLDKDKVAVIGHSMGGLTAGMLLGEQLRLGDGKLVDLQDNRVKVGVLLSAPGNGKEDLTPQALKLLPFYQEPIFQCIKKPMLVMYGTSDNNSPWTKRSADWHADPYLLSPSPKTLVTLKGVGHALGGISGYDSIEAKLDESVEISSIVERLISSYLFDALYNSSLSWGENIEKFSEMTEYGKIEMK